LRKKRIFNMMGSMGPLPQEIRLLRRAYWLTRLRWIAIAGLCLTAFFAKRVFSVGIHEVGVYSIAGLLAVYNSVVLVLLSLYGKTSLGAKFPRSAVKKIVRFQVSADMIILACLLHCSGGIENPFLIYFVFHMIIASFLLTARESFLQATLASSLLVMLGLLEYKGIIPHYCLEGFIENDQHANGLFVFGTIAAVSSALYLVVFMTSSISTRLREQEQGYWQANHMLEQKDRIKDEYVERVTHDIKGHLAAIKSSLDVVNMGLRGPLTEGQQEFVSRASERTTVLAAFVRQLLKLTQMRLCDRVEVEEFSLNDVIQKSVKSASTRAGDKEITLDCKMNGSPLMINGNVFSVEEMTTNLLLNAIKYTPKNGRVEVVVDEDAGHVRVSIKDTGIGIPEDELPLVFDEFYRASNARKVERDGTGLGLSISRQIVERHGGKIWVESELGKGTVFTYTLLLSENKAGDSEIS
jgi:signal transduction histidine kinase